MNRIDFIYFFDVHDGNPNGDPDAGNLPRLDVETGQGLVTDVCVKRKVRNYVANVRGEKEGFALFVKEGKILNQSIERAYRESERVRAALREWEDFLSKKKKRPQETPVPMHIQDIAARWMCDNFFDIRFFGAVLATGDTAEHPDVKSKIKMTAGQVRGPVQFSMARSISPIVTLEHSITRCAVTNEKDAEEKDREMGRKFTVPYGLYRMHGFINPHLAEQTGFSDDDLQMLWTALLQMWDLDRSATRGEMGACKLLVFEHGTPLGNTPARALFDLVDVRLSAEVTAEGRPPRSFADYEVRISRDKLPAEVTLHEKL